MDFSTQTSAHHFHVPVMGTGFSIDSPLKIAKYGISSVISLVDDLLVEQMREFHSRRLGLPFDSISRKDEDYRASRITAYLDLLDKLISEQVKELQASPFEPESEITRYFEMLPDSPLKESYVNMLGLADSSEKRSAQDALRTLAVPGTIDVNIMTKLDRDIYKKGEKLPPEAADAMAALRGYARSSVQSSIIFSAGINPRLYGYIARFKDFFPDESGLLRKKIVLKVSDFRSAIIQGKYLAKRGLWVSEYRIESGLNCGGHAFATDGHLMGPILREFSEKKTQLIGQLHELYNKGLTNSQHAPVKSEQEVRITVQGGIGTADEQRFLIEHYGVDGTGWGTPFLLVPEVTNVDEAHLDKLSQATESEVYLSGASPLGIPFWNLRNSASEEARRQRLNADKPGSLCPKGHLVSNSEFTKVPVCHASRTYQRQKLQQLDQGDTPAQLKTRLKENVIAKSCICNDLAGSATLKHGLDNKATTAVCCGPNIVNFTRVVSLEEMVGHIYGRLSILTESDRPHMFIRELALYVEHLQGEVQKASEGLLDKTTKFFCDFKSAMITAIDYYQELAEQFNAEQKERFLKDLEALCEELDKILPESTPTVTPGLVS